MLFVCLYNIEKKNFSLNSFYLSRMLVEFSLTCIFQHVWEKFFNLWCSHSTKMHWMYHFYSCPSPPLKTPGRSFENLFPLKTEWVEEAMTFSIKIQSENMKMTWNISYLHFVWFAMFLNVMALQFCKYLSNQIVWY